jgi:PAS domain S-box-containing protein
MPTKDLRVSTTGADRLELFALSEQVLNLLPAAVCVCDASGAIQYFNGRAAELWGREPAIGDADERFSGALRLYAHDGRLMPHAATPMADALRSGQPQRNREAVIERPDGSQVSVIVNVDPLRDEQDNLIGAVSVFHDAGPRRRAERAIRFGESRFSRFMQHLPGLAWVKDLEGRYVYANEAAAEAFGLPVDELYGQTDDDLFPAATAAQFRANDARALASAAGIQTVETLQHENGMLHHSIVSKFPILGEDGNAVAVGGMAIDVTDRLAAENALRESELRFRQLAENINEVFWMTDPHTLEVLYISPAYEQIWGETCQSLYERPRSFLERIHPDDLPRVHTDSLARQQRGEPGDVEYRIVRNDGAVRWIRDRSFPIQDESGRLYRIVGIAEDITEQRQASETASFLADASAALSGLVDYEAALERIAHMAVPYFADWCTIDLVGEQAELRRLSVAHVDPEKVKLAEEFANRAAGARRGNHRRTARPAGARRRAPPAGAGAWPEIVPFGAALGARQGVRRAVVRVGRIGTPLRRARFGDRGRSGPPGGDRDGECAAVHRAEAVGSAEGRIPGDAGPRAPQSTVADSDRPRPAGPRRSRARVHSDHEGAGQPPGADGRRPARRVADHARQDSIAARAGRRFVDRAALAGFAAAPV